MYMLSSWYTDLMDIYRVINGGGAITRQNLTLLYVLQEMLKYNLKAHFLNAMSILSIGEGKKVLI